MRRRCSSSPTERSEEAKRPRMARRFGSAMMANDSMAITYPDEHMPVKVCNGRGSPSSFQRGSDGALAERSGRRHQVLERGQDLGPLPGLQATVGVHPQPLGRDPARRLPHQLDHLLARGNVRRVDVVDARADLVRVLEGVEGIEQLHVRARRLDSDDVGVMAAMDSMMSLNSE